MALAAGVVVVVVVVLVLLLFLVLGAVEAGRFPGAARLAEGPPGGAEEEVRPRGSEVPVGAVPARGADAVVAGGFLGVRPVAGVGCVGAPVEGGRVGGFRFGGPAEEVGDVVVAVGPEAGLLGADGGA